MSEEHIPNMPINRAESNQPGLPLRLGNMPVPGQIQSRLPLGRSVSNVAQGFFQSFSQSNQHGQGSPPVLPMSVVSEPSSVVDMSSLSGINTQASMQPLSETVYSTGQGHGHIHNQGQGHGHSHDQGHGHSHTHMVPMQDENHNGVGNNQNILNDLQQTDYRPFLLWFQKSGIFFLLLFIKMMYDHRLGLLVFVALGGTFYYSNMQLIQLVHVTAIRESRGVWSFIHPAWLISFLAANIAILYYVFSEENIWKLLIFKMPHSKEVDIWTLLWMVLLTDFILKFSTVILKAIISMVTLPCLPHKRRGKYFMFVEHISQCYRQLVPILPWIHYLLDDEHTARWFSIICVILYAVFKFGIVLGMWRDLIKAFKRFRVQTNFGIKPTPTDLKSRGEHCPICQDDYREPVMLSCKHVFCEDCVSLWFDREKTCPMCRAEITDNPHFQDGSTSPHLQWY